MKIGIVGAGNMGSAFYRGLSKEFPLESLYVCDHSQEKLDALETVHASTDVNEILPKVDVVLVAIKPQNFSELMESVGKAFESKIIISIMAGISIAKIKEMTGAKKIIRAMPNLPVQVEKGVIGWVASAEVDNTEKGLVRRIFTTLGNDFSLPDESRIDAMTALSASGPAYFYFLCEMMSQKAFELGFSKEEARQIAERTLVGCASLLDSSNKTAQEWRKAVTSKGGTTEAALKYMGEKGVDKLFFEAIDEAIKRSKELNQ
jgi:pyrroline-5-carboxylate reductase